MCAQSLKYALFCAGICVYVLIIASIASPQSQTAAIVESTLTPTAFGYLPSVLHNSLSAPTATATPTNTPAVSPPTNPPQLLGWWNPAWSEDGRALAVTYTEGRGPPSERDVVRETKNEFGIIERREIYTYITGEDLYAREVDATIAYILPFTCGYLRLALVTDTAQIHYPAGIGIDQSLSALYMEDEFIYDWAEEDDCHSVDASSGGLYFGHITTAAPAGTMTYSATVTYTFAPQGDDTVYKGSVGTIHFRLDGEPYADTVMMTSYEHARLGGEWQPMTDTITTTTTYADGCQRETGIVLLWARTEYGAITGRSGTGFSAGSEMMDGTPVTYVGSITFEYGFDAQAGWYKTGYREERSAALALPKRLPFESIFIDDPNFYF